MLLCFTFLTFITLLHYICYLVFDIYYNVIKSLQIVLISSDSKIYVLLQCMLIVLKGLKFYFKASIWTSSPAWLINLITDRSTVVPVRTNVSQRVLDNIFFSKVSCYDDLFKNRFLHLLLKFTMAGTLLLI